MFAKYRRLLPFAAHQWPLIVAIVGLTAITTAVAVLYPWPLKLLIDYALGDVEPPAVLRGIIEFFGAVPDAVTLIIAAGVASLLIFVVDCTVNFALSWSWTAAGQKMVYDLAAHVFGRLQRLSLLFHSRRSVGDSLDRLATDTFCIYTAVECILVTPAMQVLSLAGITAVAWTLDPRLALIALASAPVLAISARVFGGWLKRHARRNREAQAQLVSLVQQTLSAMPLVQAYDAADRNTARFEQLAGEATRASRQNALAGKLVTLPGGLTSALGAALILVFGGQRVLAGAMTVGSLVVFLAYLKAMEKSFEKLFQTWTKLKTAEASLERVLEVLDAPEMVRDAPNAIALPRRGAAKGPGTRVEGQAPRVARGSRVEGRGSRASGGSRVESRGSRARKIPDTACVWPSTLNPQPSILRPHRFRKRHLWL